MNIRLIGVDAPELRQVPWGENSRQALTQLVEGKKVRIETDVRLHDQYDRLLAYVYADGLFVNAEMLRQGQAVMSTMPPNVAHIEDYQKAQQEAKEVRRGLWDSEKLLDVHPDCYRKLK